MIVYVAKIVTTNLIIYTNYSNYQS